jgi:hypothetical protein
MLRDAVSVQCDTGSVIFRVEAGADGGCVVIDPDWMLAVDFARTAVREQSSSMTFGRLSMLMPGLVAAHLAAWLVDDLGGACDGLPVWLRLPDELETLAVGLNPGFEVRTLRDACRCGAWFEDPDLIAPLDRGRWQHVRERHLDFIWRRVERGEYAVLEALPALLRGEQLVCACDTLLEVHARNPLVYARLVEILRGAPESPPSRFLERIPFMLTPDGDTVQFQYAVPYLLERGIAVDQVRSHLRALARVDRGAPHFQEDTVLPLILPDVLLHEPELGRALTRRALCHRSELAVREAAAMLVAIGAPWCGMLLRSVPPSVPHYALILGALGGLGPVSDATSVRPYRELFVSALGAAGRNADLRAAIDRWRVELDRFPSEHRVLLSHHRSLMLQ